MKDSIYPKEFLEQHCNENTNIRLLPKLSDMKITQTPNAGESVMALRKFERGEIIGSFTGEITTEIRQHTLQISEGTHIHDPYFVGYLLHSCNPNCVLDMSRQFAFCIQDIEEGEFITMDYASTEDVLYNQFPCSCGSANCRGWITGRAERLEQTALASALIYA